MTMTMTPDSNDHPALSVLRRVFGFDSFRPYQEEIVKAVIRGEDVFAILPTGGGKSLCYQFPAVVLDGVCVVVSPLLALMKDQVDAARKKGIRAATLNSTCSQKDYIDISRQLEANRLDLLYISPERLAHSKFIPWIKRGKIAFFAIDEAHCISQWGHSFRPDYLGLSHIIENFPKVPVAAFTATATQFVSNDIVSQLGLRHPFCVRASFDRPNLFYQIQTKENLFSQLVSFLENTQGQAGIVYCGTRRKVEKTTEILIQHGFNARGYHAGMSDEERAEVQEAFARDQVQIIVATVAFGMGIDKPNVRFVVHTDLPKNIEGYYQETGRAGRDGQPSQCLLLYDSQDISLLHSFINDMSEGIMKDANKRQLEAMIQFAESNQCRRKALLRYFGEEYPKDRCGYCDVCVHRNIFH